MNEYGFTSRQERMHHFRKWQKIKIIAWMIIAAYAGWTLAGWHISLILNQ